MSIFDGKPDRVGYPKPHYMQRAKFYYYPVVEMDSYLEKVVDLYTKELLWQQDRFMKVNERLDTLKMWADANYVKNERSKQVQKLFDLVEGREDHRVCANCGTYTDNFCIIEKGPPEENWIEDVWVRMGMLGKPICGECYYQ